MPRSNRPTRHRALGLATLSIVGGTVIGCSDINLPDLGGTFNGPTTAIAGGTGYAYVTLDGNGAPTEVGVAFTEGALTNLPPAMTEYVFVLPAEAAETPYEHAVINWQPVGHAMPAVYAVPHFDLHFYTITNAQREQMTAATEPDLAAKMARVPSSEMTPADYAADGMAIPRMGKHWRDPSSPELNGQPFTATMIFGSYDGSFIFAEPMVTTAHLATKPAPRVTPLKLPARYASTGYYPTSYTVAWDAVPGEYRIAMSGMVLR